jgi:hypothetical protein
MKAHKLVIVGFVLAIGAGSAFADDGGGKVSVGTQGAPRSISYDEFKDRCQNPDKYRGDVQRAPENIKVQCTDISHEYVADESGSVPLPAQHSVITALFSDKFNVDADTRVYAENAGGGSCLRYKEVAKTLTVEKALSCAEILGMKDDIDSYCASNIASLKSANPKLVDVKETGAVIDTCAGIVGVRGGKDPVGK